MQIKVVIAKIVPVLTIAQFIRTDVVCVGKEYLEISKIVFTFALLSERRDYK